MVTANELLASLTGSEEKVCVIDNDLRTIKIPKTITALGVEADDDVHRLQFQMPRMYGDTDLSVFNIRINYLNASNEGDIYVVTDKTVKSSVITFSWLVGPHALAYKGDVKFIVCLKESGAEGNILREFNTTITTLPVLEGLEVDAAPLEGELQDVLEQLQTLTATKVAEVEAAGLEQVQKVQEKSKEEQDNIRGTADYIRSTFGDDYETTVKMARTRANAIAQTVEGNAISVDDASDDPLRGLRVFGKSTQVSTTGKNLLNVNEYVTLSNVLGVDVTLEAGTYVVSLTSETHSGNQQPYLRFYTNNLGIQLRNGLAQTVTLTQPETIVYIYTYGMSASESVGVTATFEQLMVSKEGGLYEPYSGGIALPSPDYPQDITNIESPEIVVLGKNLLRDSKIQKRTTYNGLVCEYEGDGVFHISGTFNGTVQGMQFATSYLNMPVNRTDSFTMSAQLIEGAIPDDFHLYLGLKSETTNVRNWFSLKLTSDMKVGEVVSGTSKPGWVLAKPTHIARFWIYSYNDDLTSYTADFRIRVWFERSETNTGYAASSEGIVGLTYTLPGIPVTSGGNYTDQNGQQWVCDEIDFDRGVYIQRINKVELTGEEQCGTLADSGGEMFVALSTDATAVYTNDYVTCRCNYYHTVPRQDTFNNGRTDGFVGAAVSSTHIRITDNVRFNGDSDALNTWVKERYSDGDPVVFEYILATPIETPLTEAELAAYSALHSNYPTTTVMNDQGAHMEMKYNADTQIVFENSFRPTDAQVQAAVDAWLTAHFSSAEGVKF